MILNKAAHYVYMKPDEGEGGGGGAVDRGDNWTPTEVNDAEQLRKELASKEHAKETAVREAADKAAADKEAADKAAHDKLVADKKAVDDLAAKTKGGKADDEQTDEEKEAAEKEAADKAAAEKAAGKRIPLDRHEAILKREREARAEVERKLAAYQGQETVAKTNDTLKKLEDDVIEMEGKYAKLVADGETGKAAELMAKIRQTERQINNTRTAHSVAVATARIAEDMRYETTLERIEAAYPKLNPDHDEFDQEMADDVIDLRDVYERRGDTPAKALQKAVDKLLGKATAAQKAATETKARVDTEAAEEAAAKEATAAARKAAATAKAADAVTRQPPDTSKAGVDHDKIGGGLNQRDVLKLSQEEFAKLAEKDLAKLRGDDL